MYIYNFILKNIFEVNNNYEINMLELNISRLYHIIKYIFIFFLSLSLFPCTEFLVKFSTLRREMNVMGCVSS